MDRWAGVKFCEKIRLKCKKGPFTTQAATTLIKMPQAGLKWPVNIHCDWGEIKKIYRENNSKTWISEQFNNIFWDNSPATFFRFRIKDLQSVCELNFLIKMMRCLWLDSKFISELSHKVLVSCLICLKKMCLSNLSVLNLFLFSCKNVFFFSGGRGLQVGPTFLICSYFFLKMSYYPSFFTLTCHLRVKNSEFFRHSLRSLGFNKFNFFREHAAKHQIFSFNPKGLSV